MDENKIVIVEDDGNIIAFDDITTRHDTVNRAEVAEVEREIAELKEQKIAIDERIVELEAKLEYARKVIDIADSAKVGTETLQEVDVPTIDSEIDTKSEEE